jgi:hypothetical protein
MIGPVHVKDTHNGVKAINENSLILTTTILLRHAQNSSASNSRAETGIRQLKINTHALT